MTIVFTYGLYLAISLGITIWVGGTLYRNGRIFLVEVFHGNEGLADSVNHLLIVGFYLINLGYVNLALKISDPVVGPQQSIEALASKLGIVMLVLGGMHFFNLFLLSRVRAAAVHEITRLRVGP